MKLKKFIEKAKYSIWIPKNISSPPSLERATISDIFPLRHMNGWETHFELLDTRGLISGDNSNPNGRTAQLVFFDNAGSTLGEELIEIPRTGRKTVKLDSHFSSFVSNASAFAVFHGERDKSVNLEGSYLAERGYTGYSRIGCDIRGYVHGNIDAIASVSGKFQTIGNQGLLPRNYNVQHPLRGPATYEFFISNPTHRTALIKVLHGNTEGGWKETESFLLKSRGSKIFRIEKSDEEATFVRLRSHLYMCRPVVFRITQWGFDVFHG